MTAVGWRDGSWDRCVLGGDPLPGIVRVTVDTSRDVQAVASPGTDAVALKDQGFRGATVSIQWELWIERGDIGLLQRAALILAKLSPRRPGGVGEPVSIVHPATALAGVTHIYAASYSIPPVTGGRLIIPIKALEWFPPEQQKPAQSNGAGSNVEAGARGGEAGGAAGEVPPGAGGMGDGGPLDDGAVPPADPENLGADFP